MSNDSGLGFGAFDKYVDELIYLRLKVEKLGSEVEELRSEVTTLRIMLTEWPVRFPDAPPPVQH